MAKKEPEREKVLLVYIGECQMVRGNKQALLFKEVTEKECEEGPDISHKDDRVYSKKGLRHGKPGAIYEFEAHRPEGGLSIFPNTQKFVGNWPNKEHLLKWDSENSTYLNYLEQQKVENKESKYSELEERLAPIREQYAKTPYSRKQAFLAAVLYHITK
jgi:hypothetical protein